ncbi:MULTISPECIES: hypothetical protein [Pseudomonas]|jgi:hypothetical protein|uniref:hypothetical protein n=1 Tax=Pseudomonas sp. B21-015 TaxID=2895473 RepID=UPI00215FE5DD|nr:hypothetical protein [Pseudomonas sp. B21-015]UVM52982.1 hypothetical protein LOY38_13595 [Pseudomonas sp. B21-015]
MSTHLDTLAFSFFKLFAQYEYALKAMQFARSGSGGQAEPDWDKFSNEIGLLVLGEASEDLTGAINYLFEHPPKKQVIYEGALSWQEVPNNERSPQVLFSHIRRVRNNLYHGGKFNGRWFDPDRSEQLIGKSLVVLRALQEKHAELAEAIHGNHA